MAFIKFTETGRSFSPKASLNPRGYLSFNEGACRRYNIEEADHAFLYYDADEQRIGIELAKGEQKEGALNIRKRQTGATLGAKAFLDFFDIPIKNTTLFDVIQDNESGLLVIDLSKGKERKTKKEKDDSVSDGDISDLY